MPSQLDRIRKTKQRHGATCFKRWGKAGGNPVLVAMGQGKRVVILKK